jgi:hypothetical protein
MPALKFGLAEVRLGELTLTLCQAEALNRGGFTSLRRAVCSTFNPCIVERTSSFREWAFTFFKKRPQITM